MPTNEELGLLAFIGAGAVALFILQEEDNENNIDNVDNEKTSASVPEKEAGFLRFNQDGVYSNLLATEEHFRNLESKDGNNAFNQCAVKHLSLGANHADEAVSHSVAVGDTSSSKKYASLRDEMVSLQHDVQDGKVTPTKGIERVREIKHNFELFNPSFDLQKCKACTIN
jgi:hypothetical protein